MGDYLRCYPMQVKSSGRSGKLRTRGYRAEFGKRGEMGDLHIERGDTLAEALQKLMRGTTAELLEIPDVSGYEMWNRAGYAVIFSSGPITAPYNDTDSDTRIVRLCSLEGRRVYEVTSERIQLPFEQMNESLLFNLERYRKEAEIVLRPSLEEEVAQRLRSIMRIERKASE